MRRTSACLVLATVAVGSAPLEAQAPVPEYALKAEVLLKVLSYVQWPSGPEPAGWPIDIVVVGKSPFGTYLDDYARARTIQRRPIRVRYQAKAADVGPCHAIFICRSEAGRADAVLAWARNHQVLTVSDDESLARRGVMVNLVLEGHLVRLAVSPSAAAAAGITLTRLLPYTRILPPARPIP